MFNTQLKHQHSLSYAAMLASSLFIFGCDSDSDKSAQSEQTKAKNIIVMIADGASDGSWDIANFWNEGQVLLNNSYPFNEIDTRYAMATYSLNGNSAPDTSEDCDADTYAEGFSYVPAQAIDETPTSETTTSMEILAYGNVLETHEKCLNPEEGYACDILNYMGTEITLYGKQIELVYEGYSYINTNYTDSAAAATAIATGKSTYNGAISVDNCGTPLSPITEYVKSNGLSTGIVSSVPLSHATPAAFGAQNISRAETAQIGADMLANGYADLIMGGGHPMYDEDGSSVSEANFSYISEDAWNQLQAGTLKPEGSEQAWTFFDSKANFAALADGTASAEMLDGPLIGLFQNVETLQQARTCTSGDAAVAFSCPQLSNVPDLATMSKGALNYLSQNENGFFIMIEGGAIDWAAHANDTARIIEEQSDFNDAVTAVYDWVENNSNWDETLLIVTTDHGNSFVLGGASDQSIYSPVAMVAKETMPEVKYYSGSHTNELVRFYAKGNGSDLFDQYVIGTDSDYPQRYRHTGADGSYFQNKHIFDVVKQVISE